MSQPIYILSKQLIIIVPKINKLPVSVGKANKTIHCCTSSIRVSSNVDIYFLACLKYNEKIKNKMFNN